MINPNFLYFLSTVLSFIIVTVPFGLNFVFRTGLFVGLAFIFMYAITKYLDETSFDSLTF